jgi:hypothetical protein
MRTGAKKVTLTVICCCLVATHTLAQASNYVQKLIKQLPEVEKLYPDKMAEYFVRVMQMATALGTMTSDSNAMHALSSLFTNVVQKA